MNAMCSALAGNPALVLPSSLYQKEAPTAQQATDYLSSLAQRDPGAFLAKYGVLLSQPQLSLFEPHQGDYEVAHWLRQYQQPATGTSGFEPAGANGRHGTSSAGAAQQRNRRLAAMQRLQAKGEYFELDAMRSRAPLLYHQYIGQYLGDEPPLTEAPPLDQSAPWSAHVARSAAFSDLLAAREERAHEAAQLQREMDDAPTGQMSEHESDSEEDEQSDNPTQDPHTKTTHAQGGAAQDTNGAQTSGQPPPSHKSISAAALARKRKEFLQEMEQRFLFGQDSAHVDYKAIDQDTQLDDHWATEAGRDAEDAYFDDLMDDNTHTDTHTDTKHGPSAHTGQGLNGTSQQAASALGPDEYDY